MLMVLSIFGMTINRELPPDSALPAGATPLASSNVNDEFVTAIAMAASGAKDERFEPRGQVHVCFEFAELMAAGRYEDGLSLADDLWKRCRVQAWIWNNRDAFGEDVTRLEQLVESLTNSREPEVEWYAFIQSETALFTTVWGPLDIAHYGAGSRRRRLSRELDLVVLAPLGDTGGYLVHEPTALSSALTFVVRRVNGSWRIVNHIGVAPPLPGLPPVWWSTDDPAVEALPDS